VRVAAVLGGVLVLAGFVFVVRAMMELGRGGRAEKHPLQGLSPADRKSVSQGRLREQPLWFRLLPVAVVALGAVYFAVAFTVGVTLFFVGALALPSSLCFFLLMRGRRRMWEA
jgi:hypothetical protein